MSKCRKIADFDPLYGKEIIKFIQSIHVDGKPIKIQNPDKVLVSPRNLKTLAKKTEKKFEKKDGKKTTDNR